MTKVTWYKSQRDRCIGGVLGGLAQLTHINSGLLRIGYVAAVVFLPDSLGGILILMYVLALVILPKIEASQEPIPTPLVKGLYRSRTDKMVSGVCGGIANYYAIDTGILRIVWSILALFSGGVGVLFYLAAWCLIPFNQEEPLQAEDLQNLPIDSFKK